MKGFSSLLKQDLILAHRNGFFVVVAALALLFSILVNFVVPKEVTAEAKLYVVDLTEEKRVSAALQRSKPETVLNSEADLLARLEKEREAIGIVFRGSAEDPQVVVYHLGNEPTKAVRAVEPTISALWKAVNGISQPSIRRVESLRPGVPKPPYNKLVIPPILMMEVAFLGFFFVAVMVFQEKAEGATKAYRVSPAGTWQYILSKVLANLATALVYGGLIVLFTMGFEVDYLRLFALLAVASFLMTMVGLLLGVFYNGISDFIYAALLFLVVMALPMGAYFFPSFKLPIFDYIPTYSLLFAAREIMFPTGRTGFLGPLMLPLLLETFAVTLLTKWAVDRRLMREV